MADLIRRRKCAVAPSVLRALFALRLADAVPLEAKRAGGRPTPKPATLYEIQSHLSLPYPARCFALRLADGARLKGKRAGGAWRCPSRQGPTLDLRRRVQ